MPQLEKSAADTGSQASVPDENWNRLWPNRVHESNWLKNVVCALGIHRWHRLRIGDAPATSSRDFCRWCSKIKV